MTATISSPAALPVVTEGAYLTMHYRLSSTDGAEIVTTFNAGPATLLLGSGQLAPFLETCLLGLPEGAKRCFELPVEAAFGARNAALLRWISRATLEQNSAPDTEYRIGDWVDIAAPGGGRFAGIVREFAADQVLFDFNHPLAGQALRFEVEIIGIL